MSLDSRVICPVQPSLELRETEHQTSRDSIFTCNFLSQETVTGFRLLTDYLECAAPLVPGTVCGKDPASKFGSNFELAGRCLLQVSSHNFLALFDCSHFDIGLTHVWDISSCLRGLSLGMEHPSDRSKGKL